MNHVRWCFTFTFLRIAGIIPAEICRIKLKKMQGKSNKAI